MEYLRKDEGTMYEERRPENIRQRIGMLILCFLSILLISCGGGKPAEQESEKAPEIKEDNLVAYPGRTFSYKQKFNDLQSKQIKAT